MLPVALQHQLVGAEDQVKVTGGVELGHHVAEVSGTARAHPQPALSSGSDKGWAHIGTSCGTSCFRLMVGIWSKVWMGGDRPPWTQKTFPSTMERQGEVVEHLRAVVPHVGGAVLAHALVDKAVGAKLHAHSRGLPRSAS